MPCDREGFGQYGRWTADFAGPRGTLSDAAHRFDASARYLFALRALHRVTSEERDWLPQKDISASVQLATVQYRAWNKQSPRRVAEADRMRDLLFAAWIVALSGNAALLTETRGAIREALPITAGENSTRVCSSWRNVSTGSMLNQNLEAVRA